MKSALRKSSAGDAYCMEKIFVPFYPAAQTVVVSSGACKLNFCCYINGRVLQAGKIQLKFITTLLKLECSYRWAAHSMARLHNHCGLIKQNI